VLRPLIHISLRRCLCQRISSSVVEGRPGWLRRSLRRDGPIWIRGMGKSSRLVDGLGMRRCLLLHRAGIWIWGLHLLRITTRISSASATEMRVRGTEEGFIPSCSAERLFLHVCRDSFVRGHCRLQGGSLFDFCGALEHFAFVLSALLRLSR
jgi:hypothetical protein